MTSTQILAMDRADETGEPIFRTPCSVGGGELALRKGFVAVPMRLTRAMQDVLEQESWEWADLLMMAEATTEEEDEAIRRFESLDLLEKAEREAAERQEWPTMHPATADLVQRFSQALAEKLAAAEKKYGYSDGWLQSHWMDECRTKLLEHVAKGDPRDVAAYCAFLWHHGESTALAAPGAAIAAREQAVADKRLQWLHSPASGNVDGWEWGIFKVKWGRSEGEHQIRHTFADFSDLDEAMVASGATLTQPTTVQQAGTAAPVGWQLVPIEPTDDMEAAAENDYEDTGATFPDWKSAYRAMLKATAVEPWMEQEAKYEAEMRETHAAMLPDITDDTPLETGEGDAR